MTFMQDFSDFPLVRYKERQLEVFQSLTGN